MAICCEHRLHQYACAAMPSPQPGQTRGYNGSSDLLAQPWMNRIACAAQSLIPSYYWSSKSEFNILIRKAFYLLRDCVGSQ